MNNYCIANPNINIIFDGKMKTFTFSNITGPEPIEKRGDLFER